MSNLSAEMIKELRNRTGVGMSKCKEALVESDGDIEKAIDYLRKKGMASAVKKESRETKEASISAGQTGQALALVEVSAETDFVVKNDRFKKFLDDVANQIAETKPSSLDAFLQETYLQDKSLTIDQYRNLVMQALGENIQIKRMELITKLDKASYGIYSHMNGKIVTVVELEGSAGEESLAKDIAMHIAAEDPDYLTSEDVPSAVKKREEDIARSQIKNKPPQIVDKIIEGKLKAFCDQNCLLNQKYVKDSAVSVKQHVDAYAQKIGKSLKIKRFWRWTVA